MRPSVNAGRRKGVRAVVGPAVWGLLLSLVAAPIVSATSPAGDDTIVAEFGPHRITLGEFRIAYLDIIKNPKVFDSPSLRAEFLDQLIAERLLAAEAERQGKADDEIFQYKVSAYRDKALREEHYQAVIRPKIHVEEKDVEEVYLFTQEQRRISHLFFRTREAADSAYTAVQNGARFDSLARIVFSDTALARSGGDLGWVDWDQLDYDLGMAAFRQKTGVISSPIRSSFGYHIITVTDFKKKPLITRQEYVEHRRKAKYLLESKIGEKYAYDHIREMFAAAAITLKPDVVAFVDDRLRGQFTRKPSFADQMSEMQLRDEEIHMVHTSLWDARREVMAVVNGSPYTVGDFIGALTYVPYAVVYGNTRASLDYALRDALLTREALSMGLGDKAAVRQKTRLFREHLLQLGLRRELVRSVTVTDSELVAYYERHRSTFKGATFDQSQDFIRDVVLTQKKQQVVPAHLAAMTSSLKIAKDLAAINAYYDAILRRETP